MLSLTPTLLWPAGVAARRDHGGPGRPGQIGPAGIPAGRVRAARGHHHLCRASPVRSMCGPPRPASHQEQPMQWKCGQPEWWLRSL